MYITSPKRKNGSTVIRLVESFWKDGKVKNRIVKTIGQSKDPRIIEHYKKTARKLLDKHKKGLISFKKVSEKLSIDLLRFHGEDRYNTGFEDIFGASYEQLGFKTLIKSGKNNTVLNEVLSSLVLMRLFSPASKLRSCGLLEKHFNKILSHKRILGMMDHLSKKEEEIKGEIFGSVLKGKEKLEMLLFDVTTLSFESVSRSDLKDFGYSKDGKFNEVQVVLAVAFPARNKNATLIAKSVKKAFPFSKKTASVLSVSDTNFPSENNHSTFTTPLTESAFPVATEASLTLPTSKSNLPIKSKSTPLVVESIQPEFHIATNTTLTLPTSRSTDLVERESRTLVAEFKEQDSVHSEEASFVLPTSETHFPPSEEASFAEFDSELHTVFFEINSSKLTLEAQTVLNENIQWLKENPYITEVTLEGHCDPLGSEEYNIELGWKRVNSVKEYLIFHGIPEEKLKTISYGEAKPLSLEEDEGNIKSFKQS